MPEAHSLHNNIGSYPGAACSSLVGDSEACVNGASGWNSLYRSETVLVVGAPVYAAWSDHWLEQVSDDRVSSFGYADAEVKLAGTSTVAPEPTTFLLVGATLIGAAALRRKKK